MGEVFSAIYKYLWAVFYEWWWLVTVLLFGLDKVLEWAFPRYRVWLKETFSEEERRRYFWRTLLAFVFLSGFLAWKEEHTARLISQEASQKELSTARERIASLEAQPRMEEEVQAKVDGLTQTNQRLEKEVTRLREQLGPWILTEDQRKKIIEEVSKVPPGETYALGVHVIPGCSVCSGYADDLIRAWGNIPGWKVNGTTHFGLNPRLTGVTFAFDSAVCPPGEVQLVKKAFDAAGIKHSDFFLGERDKKDLVVACGIFVGNRSLE